MRINNFIPPTLLDDPGPKRGKHRKYRSEVQSIIVSKRVAGSVAEARKEVPEGFKTKKVDVKLKSYRFRQKSPGQFDAFRVQPVKKKKGVTFVLGLKRK